LNQSEIQIENLTGLVQNLIKELNEFEQLDSCQLKMVLNKNLLQKSLEA
jgi:hypothetical protein